MNKSIQLTNASAEICSFESTGEVKELHVMIHAQAGHTFQQQLEAVLDGYEQLKANELKGATAIVKIFSWGKILSTVAISFGVASAT